MDRHDQGRFGINEPEEPVNAQFTVGDLMDALAEYNPLLLVAVITEETHQLYQPHTLEEGNQGGEEVLWLWCNKED